MTVLSLLSGCTSSSRSSSRAKTTSPTATARADVKPAQIKPGQIRQPAVVLRFEFGSGTFSEEERTGLPETYEGTLLDALNAKAVLARDVRVLKTGEKFDARAGVRQAREIEADHVIVVNVLIERGEMPFCSGSRRPFRVPTTRWTQTAQVIRVRDGATSVTVPDPGVALTEFEADCESPAKSRQRSRDETLTLGVETLLKRVVGP